MSDQKVTAGHLRRAALVYCRQSTLIQVQRNRGSTSRQYDLVSRAAALGWPRAAVRVIDADLGVSGAGLAARAGFTEPTEQIALGQVGVVLGAGGLPAGPVFRRAVLAAGPGGSPIPRSPTSPASTIPACSMTGCCGAQGDHERGRAPGAARRMLGGLRNKAARGEPRIPLPAGRCGASSRGRSCCTPTRRSGARSAPCSSVSPRPGRPARSGCGCARTACSSRPSGTGSWPGPRPPTRRCTRS